jgi:hypothetical protein
MTETIDQRVGIDRCEGALQTLFALTLMEIADTSCLRPGSTTPGRACWSQICQISSGPARPSVHESHDANRLRLHRSDVRHDDPNLPA